MNRRLNILLLTSMPLNHSANLGLDMVESLEARGHHVDVITKYKEKKNRLNVTSVYDIEPPPPTSSLRHRLVKRFPLLRYLSPKNYFLKKNQYKITNKIENEPPVDATLITAKIQKEYNLVITLFWQYMITTATLKEVYEKLKCPIFIQAVDMFPMTGGCFYFWECRRFIDSCGKCPGLFPKNENDQTHKNHAFKKEVYASIEYVFIGNTWMCEWARKSSLFKPSRIKRGGFAINQNAFLNRNKQEAKTLLKLPPQKQFVIFAGAAILSDERKGFDILVKSLAQFTEQLSCEERSHILLILGGKNFEDIQQYFQIDLYNPGFMDPTKLALTYAASDVYLSTTIEDAGPTMINQSLLCGTPVVAFKIGVALDIVETGVTGYRAQYKDVNDYTQGIQYIYQMDVTQKELMSERCREIALKENSFSSFANRIEQIYEECSSDASR